MFVFPYSSACKLCFRCVFRFAKFCIVIYVERMHAPAGRPGRQRLVEVSVRGNWNKLTNFILFTGVRKIIILIKKCNYYSQGS